MKKKIKFRLINKTKIKKLKKYSYCLALAITTSFCANGLPHDSINNNKKEFNNNGIYYDNNNEGWIIDSRCDNEEVIKNIDKNNKYDTIIFNNNCFITDLKCLESIKNEINSLIIYDCPSLIDLEEIYNMPNLKHLYIQESAGITKDLVEYLDNKKIDYTFPKNPLEIRKWLDEILNKTINDSMDDFEKVKAISFYLANNFKYNINLKDESNKYPISCLIENGCGVCASDAYVGTLLFNLAGIEAYEIKSNSHGWVLVKLNEKYYYVDITHLRNRSYLNCCSIENFNFAPFYLNDPGENLENQMKNYFDNGDIIISNNLVNNISNSEINKNIFERNPIQTFNYFLNTFGYYIFIIKGSSFFDELNKVKKRKNIEK